MDSASQHIIASLEGFKREFGSYDGGRPGPMMVFLGGVHGNEPSGIQALSEVFKQLKKIQPIFNGKIIALLGNIEALKKGVRFVDYDLNRIWISRENHKEHLSEEKEKRELSQAIIDLISKCKGEIYFFDLHSTSAESIPFSVIADTLDNRRIAQLIPAPVILGLEELMKGTLFSMLTSAGFPSIIFEGGQHTNPNTSINQQGFIWKVLEKIGALDLNLVPGAKKNVKKLELQTSNNQKFYEVKYKYEISDPSRFKMHPGFINFQKVNTGQKMAVENGQEIIAKIGGKIFMPKYQELGAEGFFIVSKIQKFWIWFSRILRMIKLEHLLHWFPGVYKTDAHPLTFKVDTNIARIKALDFFHLLGYRMEKREKNILFISRRNDEKNLKNSENVEKLKKLISG